MAKTKNKKNRNADSIRRKKKEVDVKANPFEVKVNRQKHKILNKKISKSDKGLPGVSRSKSIQKRKETLLNEFTKRTKSGGLFDKRLGENDPNLSAEEKMLQRFAVEKKRHHEKTRIFNLDEEPSLTHLGQSLADVEKFEEPVISDDEDDEDRGKLSAKHVAAEHFGGGLLQKTPGDQQKSWRERMDEIIIESKRKKHDKQRFKDELEEATSKVDEQWKNFHPLLAAIKRKKEEMQPAESGKTDEYDRAVKELHFDLKAKATDRVKTEEELAQEEKERLEKLEAERLLRMRGHNSAQTRYRSADDLEDEPTPDFAFNPQNTEDGSQSEEDEGSHEGEGDDNNEEDDDGEEQGSDKEEEEDENDEEEEVDQGSDLSSSGGDDDVDDHSDADEAELRNQREEAATELPYTFAAPGSYEDLESLLVNRTNEDQLTIITRLRACYHPSLADGNKSKLMDILKYLLTYQGLILTQQPPNLALADGLAPHFYALCHVSPNDAAAIVMEELKSMQNMYNERAERRNGRGLFPALNVLLFFKLVSLLFPTSDLRHPVTSPAQMFMSQILTESSLNNCRDVACGLILCSIFLEYVKESKRFIPEVVDFLVRLTDENKVKLLAVSDTKNPDNIPTTDPIDISKVFTPSEAFVYLKHDHFKYSALNLAKRLLHIAKEPLFTPKKPICKKSSQIQQIKMLEPKFEESYDPTKKKGGSDKVRLMKKLKRETKGAIREIRKDTKFLAKVKLEEQIQKDKERKRKVAKLLGDLATQEGEVRGLKRMKTKL